jgi:glycosyltransferase involved in cell wall biosynthesis
MKIALVHDYLNEFGGAERVLLALSEMYPDAPIYTIYYKKDSPSGKVFAGKKIIQSWFSYLPFANKLISPLRFLVPAIWGSLNFSKFDLVVTSASWAVTKGMRNAKKEICYLHTPPRYLWGYDTSRDWKSLWFAGLVKIYALVVNHFMRMYDFQKAQEVDLFIANSGNIGKRIEKFYRINNYKVIYPPVDIEKFSGSNVKTEQGNYYLTGGRLTHAKNFDLIIKACRKAGVKLKIFGTGVEETKLKRLADKNVEFLGRVSDEKLVSLYKGAKAFIAAGKDEDFGITLVETAAAGCPSIAFKAEGYLESVVENKTGLFFNELSESSLAKAIKKSEKMKWNKSLIKNHAKKFGKERFEEEIKQVVQSVLH